MEKLTPIADLQDIKETAKESHQPAIIAFAEQMDNFSICLTEDHIENIKRLLRSISVMLLKDQLRFLGTISKDFEEIQKTTHSKCISCLRHGKCETEKSLI